MNKIFLLLFIAIISLGYTSLVKGDNTNLDDPYSVKYVVAVQDTVPPLQERFEDFINSRRNNPFDLEDPKVIEKNVEYDPETDRYIISEKIGDEYFRPPTYMTFDEFVEWKNKQAEQEYFEQLAGVSSGKDGLSALDPIAKFDVENSLLDRLFGGNEVDIRPQGGIDLTFGIDHSKTENPVLIERQSRQTVFDFDMDINMNVTGKIGEKLNLNTNYNTNATFDFDNQIKLDYNSDLFDDDAIVKKIEAGNVSLPLRGTLIQGAQSLFGLKTELQFGHLRLTAIASQQKSQRENIQIEGGAQLQEFEVRADEYDENRHFFLSHYNRDVFEFSLENMPQVKGLFQLENIEVWITNDRNEVENVRDIVALADLGEPTRLVSPDKITQFQTPRYQEICDGKPLPENGANGLRERLRSIDGIKEIDKVVSILQSSQFGLAQSKDFEKVSARLLRPSEYTIHPQLGFISLNINVQPDQVVGVSFRYTYNGEIFEVGDFANNTDPVVDNSNPFGPPPGQQDTSMITQEVMFVKMLKSTTQRTDVPTWDLMMKNVYPIGAFQVSQEDFQLDIFYDDPGRGLKRFLPETNLAGVPLLQVFNLDNLNIQGDPNSDGVFDYVPGITINPRNGRVMFPVLEPFGTSLGRRITDDRLRERFTFQELYDKTVFLAREFPEKNRYVIKGSYKSSVSSEISLGAFNIPQGSVRVSAGGQQLIEGTDYEIDYNIGKVRILNDALLNAGVPINVSFEDNTLFGFQTKTMLGLRADYEVDENFNIGATFLQLFERPFTQKVNIGEDPINNKIYGLDFNISREAPWLTKVVDAIPGLQTKAPSNISISAEAAALKPGHSRAINQSRKDDGGLVYIDDFEGSASSFDLRQPVNNWFLASVPQNDSENNNPLFPEAALVNNLASGANRAKLSWYRIDPSVRSGDDQRNPYTSLVEQNEVFPNLRLGRDQLTNIQTFDLAYYPNERGPYNFDLPNGYPGLSSGVQATDGGQTMVLNDPETRWAGVMRALQTNDFQSANIEFLEFWMLSPFMSQEDPLSPSVDIEGQEGDLYINLGNISEDILRDSRKVFENGLPTEVNPDRRVIETNWSRVPVSQQITRAFDNGQNTREAQDLGLDGINNDDERTKFRDYISAISGLNANLGAMVEEDPSNDDFLYYRDNSYTDSDGILTRYRDFNNPQGNSRSNINNAERESSTNIPDAEDLNRDNTLNETESYFQYKIPLRFDRANPREIDVEATPFITDRREDENTRRVWYRFRVPLRGPDKVSVGGIVDFRSIRFMRMYMHGFRRPVVLRFARMELVRNQWRKYTQDLSDIGAGIDECEVEPVFEVDAVNIEENSDRVPFNYVLPEGIQRERTIGVFSALQNEQSLSLKVENLCDGEDKAVFKNLDFDFRVYDRMKMFVHAESSNDVEIPRGELKLFVRLGSDFKNNYYEYEIPLAMSNPDSLPTNTNSSEYKQQVWLPENEVDLDLKALVNLKQNRNAMDNTSLADEFEMLVGDNKIKVRGNPNIGYVKVMMIGIRNPYNADGAAYSAEVWANELRVTGLDERGGVAALARMDVSLADFGNLTVSGNYSSIGFGALDQKVQERSREENIGYDLAGSFELGKFFPEKWGLRLPVYAQFSKSVSNPEFDPYDLDIPLKDKIAAATSRQERDSIKRLAQDVTTIKSVNFTNVRKERTNTAKKPLPWDIENFSFTYAYTETERRDPIIEFDQEKKYSGAIDYSFTLRPKYIQPFKKLIKKDKYLKLLKELNFNPLPNSFNFSTIVDRRFATTKYRFTDLDDTFSTFYNKKFTWDRDYNLNWDLTKSLKLNFNAVALSYIDEPEEFVRDQEGIIIGRITDDFRRDSIWNNVRDLGRLKNYQHSIGLSYTAPLRYLPFMDWVQVRGNYQSTYTWTAAALNTDSLGNVIQNTQNRQVNADLSFDKLYNSIPFLKKVNQSNRRRSSRNQSARRTNPRQGNTPANADEKDKKKKKDGEVSTVAKVLVRPLLLLRKARFAYTEKFRTVVPGFTPEARLLGLSSGFDAPGWGFVAGLQPKIRTLDESQYGQPGVGDWLHDNQSWITDNVFLNNKVIQDYSQNLKLDVALEPFNDFKVDLTVEKTFEENHSQIFKNLDKNSIGGLEHAVPQDIGQLSVSYLDLRTLFNDSPEELNDLYSTFLSNRVIISNRLGTGEHEEEPGFAAGYGKSQQDVLVYSFLAAYNGEDPNSMDLDIFSTMPQVNWRVSYNGLSRIPLFQELFDNFTLNHAYVSKLNIARYNTGLPFLRTRDEGGIDPETRNFYSRIEIPDITIQTAFSPLISISSTLTNGVSFNVDYKKQRTLAMSALSKRLNETYSEEIVVGFGVLMRDVEFGFLKGKRSRNKKKKEEEQPQQPNNQNQRGSVRNSQLQGRDLDINFDFSLRDDVTYTSVIEEGGTREPTRGNYALALSPSAEYQLNDRLAVRLFFDYRRNIPKTSAGFPRTNASGGFIVRFSLN